ncbi:hypothetical protein AGMMS49940_02680 [Spirochaetia bacterium]|nr:hypothetical protein AGMMS49940_02680 [Spirochaetia bacterium]
MGKYGKPLKQFYQADFVCFEKIIIEIKVVTKLAGESRAQVMNYLAATGWQGAGFFVLELTGESVKLAGRPKGFTPREWPRP